MASSRFDKADSLGSRSQPDIAQYLMEIEDADEASLFLAGKGSGQALIAPKKSYTQTGFILGYIPPSDAGSKTSEISGISQVEGDKTLIGKRIKISLDKFYIDDYPGFGQHTVLCEFAGKNQVAGEAEELRFALRFKASDKASASLSGVPIFLGVTVGQDGISFEGRTINVSSSTDEIVLATLDSPAFKNGLSLINAAQPALKPFAELAAATVKTTMSRKRNAQVHNFNLGLDFSSGSTSARLMLGSYVVIQSDEPTWDWADLVWDKDAMSLRYTDDSREVRFNYMVFGVSSFSG